MKKIKIGAISLAVAVIMGFSGCGSDDEKSDVTNVQFDFSGTYDFRDYIAQSADGSHTLTYSVFEKFDGGTYQGSTVDNYSITGDTITFYDDEEDEYGETLTVEDLKMILTHGENSNFAVEYARKIDINDVILSENFSEKIDEYGATGSISGTVTLTLKNHHDTINFTHEGNNYSYSDVLEIEALEITSGSVSENGQTENLGGYDKSTEYFAKGIGMVASIDFDCIDEDLNTYDNIECETPEYYKEFYNQQ